MVDDLLELEWPMFGLLCPILVHIHPIVVNIYLFTFEVWRSPMLA